MSDYTLKFGRQTWVGPSCCSFGDHGGAGDVGRSNIDIICERAGNSTVSISYEDLHEFLKYIERRRQPYFGGYYNETVEMAHKLRTRPNVIRVTGAYAGECVLIREGWEEGAEILAQLDEYPILDDDACGAVVLQWEQEAWESYVSGDIWRKLARGIESGDFDVSEYWDSKSDDDKWTLYRNAMEESNTDPVAEYNGVHIDIGAIMPHIKAALLGQFQADVKAATQTALREYHANQGALLAGEYLPDVEDIAARVAADCAAPFIY